MHYNKALITGSKSGLGKALANLLETKGILVLRTSSSDADLSKRSERKKLLALIDREKPNLLVNNAGIGFYGECTDLSLDDQLKILEVNCAALIELSIHFAKVCPRPSTILNISSAAAFFPFPSYNLYAASKRFVNQFSKSLDAELKPKGIRVLCACLGPIKTNFRLHAAKGHPQKNDRRSITPERAAKFLWKQLKTQKRLTIFGPQTKVMVCIGRLLPESLRNKILLQEISNRMHRSI